MWPYLLGLAALASLLAAASALRRLVVVTVTGDSMMPALAPGDRVLVCRVRLGNLRRGQMVVAERPDANGAWAKLPRGQVGSRRWLVKRVAALPGDPWPVGRSKADVARPLVPPHRFAILGDNEAWSVDSRTFGCIPGDRLLGIVVRKLPRNDLEVSQRFHNRCQLPRRDPEPDGQGARTAVTWRDDPDLTFARSRQESQRPCSEHRQK
jgi:signal peptidase I